MKECVGNKWAGLWGGEGGGHERWWVGVDEGRGGRWAGGRRAR